MMYNAQNLHRFIGRSIHLLDPLLALPFKTYLFSFRIQVQDRVMRFDRLAGELLVSTFKDDLPEAENAARLKNAEREHRVNPEVLGSNTSEPPNSCHSGSKVANFLTTEKSRKCQFLMFVVVL